MKNNHKRFLKDAVVVPRLDRICRQIGGLVPVDVLRTYLDTVWASLLNNLLDPIHSVATTDWLVVTFMGCVRFSIRKPTGMMKVASLANKDGEVFFARAERVCIDLPIRLTGFWINAFLMSFDALLDQSVPDNLPAWVKRSLRKRVATELIWALRQSVHWRSLRHALRDALQLDRQLLQWVRHGRHAQHRFAVLDWQYNWAISQRHHYVQLATESPNLLWLFNFLTGQGISLPAGDIVAAMKQWVLDDYRLRPAAWRFLQACQRQHFWHVIDFFGPQGETDERWKELVHWLAVIQLLHRKKPIHPDVVRLFFHDSFEAKPRLGLIKFRSLLLKSATMRDIVQEAERRQANGSLDTFIEKDLVEVLSWLQVVQPALDTNQCKRGWPYLAKQAMQWKSDAWLQDQLHHYRWESLIPVIAVETWTVVPIIDAWTLREEALAMRHCADNYIPSCINGTMQMFSVRNSANKRVATLGLEKSDQEWVSIGIRRFANADVSRALQDLEYVVVARCNDLPTIAPSLCVAASVESEKSQDTQGSDITNDVSEYEGVREMSSAYALEIALPQKQGTALNPLNKNEAVSTQESHLLPLEEIDQLLKSTSHTAMVAKNAFVAPMVEWQTDQQRWELKAQRIRQRSEEAMQDPAFQERLRQAFARADQLRLSDKKDTL